MRQNFPVYQLFWNLNILFNEINSLQYKNLKESDRHNFPSHSFKPTIWDHCQTSVNWKSHYQRDYIRKTFFWSYYTFLLQFIKRPTYLWITLKYIFIYQVQKNGNKVSAWRVLVDEKFRPKFATKKLYDSNLDKF